MNQTIMKFGYPQTLVAEYDHWVILLRRSQITAGSLVIACRHDAQRLPDVPDAAWAEFPRVAAHVEAALRDAVEFEKINYLALMMVDPHVHFHVVPRYEGTRAIAGVDIEDGAWPGPPDVTKGVELTDAQIAEAAEALCR